MSSVVRRSIAHRYGTRSNSDLPAVPIVATATSTATATTTTTDTAIEIVDLVSETDQPAPAAATPNTDTKTDLYKQLQELEQQDGVIRNMNFMLCLLCKIYVDVYDGILIRECLHQVCIDCIRKFIIDSPHVEIQCPSDDCECFFEDREIRSLLTQVEYERHINKYILAEPKGNEELYKELLDLEQQGLVYNTDPFECEICMTDIEVHDGIFIRECLHQFCIDCVRHTIIHSEEAEIKCPANACDCIIQDREIRSLLTQAEFDKHDLKTLRIAESQATNSYHCKKANCEGWCIVEDAVNTFVCPRCGSENCLACQVNGFFFLAYFEIHKSLAMVHISQDKNSIGITFVIAQAIHSGQNCKQYQEELRYAGMTDSQRSELCLDEIVQKNHGMRCTKCKVMR